MSGHHDVHVGPGANGYGWTVRQTSRVVSTHRMQATAVKAGRSAARRDHVELVIHGRDGRIRAKDTYGRESTVLDTER